MKIVIAQNVPTLRAALRKHLEAQGFEVIALEDLVEILDYVRAHDVRLIIVGWRIARLDLSDLCRQLRAGRPGGPYVHVVLLSTRLRGEDRVDAFRAGIDAFLSRPVDPSELYSRVQAVERLVGVEDQLRKRLGELERLNGEVERRNTLLAEIASCDGLTGLKNHRYFREALEANISLSRRRSLPLSVVMIDVDQFKPYNDRFGHPAGDEALCEVASLLRSCVREHDVVARYGGEEFAVLLPATDAEAGRALAERLRVAIEQRGWPNRPITISLGVATLPAGSRRPVGMIEDADRSLYRSKAEGRNRVTHADDLAHRPTPARSADHAHPDSQPVPSLA